MDSRMTRRRALVSLAGATSLATSLPLRAAYAQDITPIKFVLDWKLQGIHAWYYRAEDRGYFAQEKLAVTIDQGDGSAAVVTKVMAGAYQAGFGDVNAIVQNASSRPGMAPVMVYMIYNRAPFAILVRAGGPIRTLKDLEGKSIGTPAGGAAARMFPVMAGKNGVDPDKEVRWFHYGEHGVDLYGNGVMVSQQMIRDRPQAVAGLVRAVHKGVRDTLAEPDAAIEALLKREPLLNKGLEKRRLMHTLKTVMLTLEVASNGFGDVGDARFARSFIQLKEAFDMQRVPTAAEVFDRRFLPPLAERKFALK